MFVTREQYLEIMETGAIIVEAMGYAPVLFAKIDDITLEETAKETKDHDTVQCNDNAYRSESWSNT